MKYLMLLLTISSSVTALAETCYSGKFDVPTAGGRAEYSFEVRGDQERVRLNTTVLNPDVTINNGQGIQSRIGDQFRPDHDLPLLHTEGEKCPCVSWHSEDRRLILKIEFTGDHQMLPTLSYFGLPTQVTEVVRCK